ncbi:MAG: transposase [Janthinobacterium lividum]
MQPYRQVTDEEWARVEPLIPELKYNPTRDPRGRPMTSRRDCLNATIWVMYSGASWQNLPRRYPSYQTCHRSFKAWYDAGVMHRIAHTLFGTAAHNFLEVVSARIRSGTKARQALNAAAADGAAAAGGKPPAARHAALHARGGRDGMKARQRGSGTTAAQAAPGPRTTAPNMAARKASVRKAAVPKVPLPKIAVPKAAVPKAAVSKAAVSKAAVSKVAISKVAVPKVAISKVAVPKAPPRKVSGRKTAARRVSAAMGAARAASARTKVRAEHQ